MKEAYQPFQNQKKNNFDFYLTYLNDMFYEAVRQIEESRMKEFDFKLLCHLFWKWTKVFSELSDLYAWGDVNQTIEQCIVNDFKKELPDMKRLYANYLHR